MDRQERTTSRWAPKIATALVLGSAVLAASAFWPQAGDAASPAKNDAGQESSQPQTPQTADTSDYIMHEWGTFTTFSGSDGAYLDFRPLAVEHNDLPRFVFDRGSYSERLTVSKSRLFARVRMETPVTYFYTDRVQSVDVKVDFPKGLLTEFYPPAKAISPKLNVSAAFGEGEAIGNSSLDWGTVRLIPTSQLAPGVSDPALQAQLAQHIASTVLPMDGHSLHYSHARHTDSALVHVHSDRRFSQPMVGNQTEYLEKFLFYRGVGQFDLPVKVSYDDGSPLFTNDCDLPVRSILAIESNGDRKFRAAVVSEVGAGESVTLPELKSLDQKALRKMVVDALVGEGLYEKEAYSMVNTWQDSWFDEPGLRVLYMVPGATTEELLPLHLNPAPAERLRVLVGRMEVMSPTDEAELIADVSRSMADRQAFPKSLSAEEKAAKKTYPFPKSIKQRGRMAEPALVRVSKIAKDKNIRQEAEWLIRELRGFSS